MAKKDILLPQHTKAPKHVSSLTQLEAYADLCLSQQQGRNRPNGHVIVLSKHINKLTAALRDALFHMSYDYEQDFVKHCKDKFDIEIDRPNHYLGKKK